MGVREGGAAGRGRVFGGGAGREHVEGGILPRGVGLEEVRRLARPAGLAEAVAAANLRLPDYAQVRRWVIAEEPFSIANGLLTANGRPRRTRILARYGAALEALYRDQPEFEPSMENA